MAVPVFALLIGINNYKSGEIWNLQSCVDDVNATRRWLRRDLHVPEDHISVLTDKRATKRGIEVEFMNHLINNSAIERGDAIIIYFAGHGSSIPAPRSWYHGQERIAEMLCPYDHDTMTSEGRIAGISDRSLHAMLSELRSAKGSNITVILDACFSPLDARLTPSGRRSVRWTPTHRANHSDLAATLWPSSSSRSSASEEEQYGGFQQAFAETHVLLAACGPGQLATEDKNGGNFTSALLEVLRRNPLHTTSYMELIDALPSLGLEQEPQCVGRNGKRLVFCGKPFGIDGRYVSVDLDENKKLRVEAGAMHGVVEGTEFTVHAHNRRGSWNPVVSILTVYDVHPSWSRARYKTPQRRIEYKGWALVTRWNNRRPFRVHLKRTFPSCLRWWKSIQEIPTKVGGEPSKGGINLVRVQCPGEADLSATLHRREVVLERNDATITRSCARLFRSPVEHPGDLSIIDEAARFHSHLHRENPDDRLRNQVTMELYRLDPSSWSRVGHNLLHDGKAQLVHEQDALYGVTLRNSSNVDLWPYLAYMDTSGYAISRIYHAESSFGVAPLRAHSELTIGTGSAGSEALTFSLGDDEISDSGFLKLFFSTTFSTMTMIEQGPPLTQVDSVALYRKGRRSSTSSETMSEVWGTSLACVTVVRDPFDDRFKSEKGAAE